jgi:hypothetical protein
MGSSVVRSSSNNSIASTASQRIPSALGNAVSKTWLRARGVGGSMSISALGQLREPDSASSSFSRSPSRNLSSVTPPPPEPYVWPEGALKRGGRNTRGHVFGKPLDITGRTWGVVDASEDRDDEAEYAQRRRRCLPAVASRCVEYLTFWGPQEEGIFRISGRSSHINRLRYLFDAGGDLDLVKCAPSEMDESDPDPLDPHAVASLFKSFIRELPEPILTPFVEGKLDDFRGDDINVDDLATVIAMLSSSSWFLLADIIMLIDLIPRHASVNRMTHNALMISLGPTLRLSGEHVALLLRHREHIFEKPPLVSADQINFGSDDEIALSPAFDETPLPITSTPSPVMVPLATGPKPRPMSRLSKRPSFSNLLSNSIRRSQSEHLLPVSITSVGPPRLVTEFPSDDIQEEIEPEVKADVKSTDAIQETHYAPGTVAERARVFSTPIADRFRRDSILQDLRPPESSSSSISSHSSVRSSSDLAAPPNPIAGLRRSPPLFFQSTSASAGDSIAVVGTKRNADAGTGEAPGGAKRLSSGPGPED